MHLLDRVVGRRRYRYNKQERDRLERNSTIARAGQARRKKNARPAKARTDARAREVLSKATGRAAKFLSLSPAELAAILGLSKATAAKLMAGEWLMTKGSAGWRRAILFIRAWRALVAIVGTDEHAAGWFRGKTKAFGSSSALKYSATLWGLWQVVRYLEANTSIN